MKLRRTYILPMLLFVMSSFAILLSITARASGPQIINYQYPLDYRVNVLCRDNVTVRLSGTVHVTYKAMPDANEGYHVTSHSNWQGVTGINEETGEIYHFIGGGNNSFNSHGEMAFTSNMVSNGAAVSAGEGIIFFVHNIYHVTMTPEGVLSAQFMNQTADCRNE